MYAILLASCEMYAATYHTYKSETLSSTSLHPHFPSVAQITTYLPYLGGSAIILKPGVTSISTLGIENRTKLKGYLSGRPSNIEDCADS
jgi:hypothetical protein